MIAVRSEMELELLRRAASILREVMESVGRLVAPGISTSEIDRFVEDLIVRQGGRPAFKGYRGFPAASCISIDDEVVHGIPGPRRLREGQIVSIDIGVEKEGYFSDMARTFPVGEVPQEKIRLMRRTEEALWLGISQARDGRRVGDISHAIQSYVEAAGYSVVRDLVGHGIGRQMHEEPQIPNFGSPGTGPRLRSGMVLAIEPMVNAGKPWVRTRRDGWTVITKDGLPSAHFEHTVVVTDGPPEVLTASPQLVRRISDFLRSRGINWG